jgi:hypothetical protein
MIAPSQLSATMRMTSQQTESGPRSQQLGGAS